ncbi:hypothetical protein V6N11_080115 [Hibiscus sabdariffa]|uniref:Uncharacterized protein n=1 Tax=Hibiscus sabdariffa TaxID=183260 RepID=A0ABR2RXR0_9ROSI
MRYEIPNECVIRKIRDFLHWRFRIKLRVLAFNNLTMWICTMTLRSKPGEGSPLPWLPLRLLMVLTFKGVTESHSYAAAVVGKDAHASGERSTVSNDEVLVSDEDEDNYEVSPDVVASPSQEQEPVQIPEAVSRQRMGKQASVPHGSGKNDHGASSSVAPLLSEGSLQDKVIALREGNKMVVNSRITGIHGGRHSAFVIIEVLE